MILTSISVAMAVFVLYLYRLGQRGAHVPPWFHIIVTRYVARLVGMTSLVKHHPPVMNSASALASGVAAAAAAASGTNITRNIPQADPEESRPLRLDTDDLNNTRYKLIQLEGNGLYILSRDGEHHLEKEDKEDLSDLQRVNQKARALRQRRAAAMRVGDMGRNNNTPTPKERELMWQDISEVTDRFFFWFCFITVTLTTISILVIMPLTKPDPLSKKQWTVIPVGDM